MSQENEKVELNILRYSIGSIFKTTEGVAILQTGTRINGVFYTVMECFDSKKSSSERLYFGSDGVSVDDDKLFIVDIIAGEVRPTPFSLKDIPIGSLLKDRDGRLLLFIGENHSLSDPYFRYRMIRFTDNEEAIPVKSDIHLLSYSEFGFTEEGSFRVNSRDVVEMITSGPFTKDNPSYSQWYLSVY